MADHIRYEVEGGIGTLTIDRPEKRNAMTYAMLADFHDAIERAGRDDATRVVILTGAGGAFCAGTDLSDLANTPERERGGGGRADAEARPWPLVRCPVPVIAAVDGAAVGMGAEFTLQCDVRIASDRARFAWNFGHRGLVPDTGAGSWLLPRIVGLPQALRMLYSGEFVSAEEALALGYVARVVEPDLLMQAAREEAERFLSISPLSARLMKDLVYRGLERDVQTHMRAHAEALAACFASDDHREGVAAFLERRPARFTGR
jgi:enoyl-CoA hydratase